MIWIASRIKAIEISNQWQACTLDLPFSLLKEITWIFWHEESNPIHKYILVVLVHLLVSDRRNIGERKPFVSIICNPGIVKARHKQKSSKNWESNSWHRRKQCSKLRTISKAPLLLPHLELTLVWVLSTNLAPLTKDLASTRLWQKHQKNLDCLLLSQPIVKTIQSWEKTTESCRAREERRGRGKKKKESFYRGPYLPRPCYKSWWSRKLNQALQVTTKQ